MSDVSELNRHTETTSTSSVALEPGYEPPPILYAGEERSGSLFLEYFRTLVRYRWFILALGIGGIVGSFVLNFNALPVYRSRTSLDIQSLNTDFMNMKAVAPTGDGTDPSQDDYVQTQIKLLQSDTLLERTVQHLQSQPHPEYIEKMDIASRLERALHLVHSKQIPYSDLINDAASHVTVKPLGITRLVEITCDSWSSDFSATFCNTLVEQFREGDLEMRMTESQKTSDWLTKQVADVKVKAEESEKQLEAATGGNGLVLSQESTGVEEDRLRDMQSEYVKAEADRMEKEAAAGIGSSSTPGMDPDLNESPAYQHYAQNLADLQSEVAKLVPPLTEEDPKVIHLRSQIKAVEADMAAERGANSTHLKDDYEAAVHREQMLAGAYQREESSVSSDLGKASKVALLRREVDSEQQLYQTLLQLAREAGFASAIHASTIRVVDAAEATKIPFSPRRGTSAASGLLVGTLCGVGLAFFMERTTTVFRLPGDTERYLGLRELGVIPSSVRQRKVFAPTNADGAEIFGPRDGQRTLSNWTGNFSIVAEAYRSATTSIMLSEHPREHGRVYVLSSPNAGEGKTTVVSNLGVALSKSRLRVLLIDGDLRKPALHKVLQVPNEFGLRNLLRGETIGDSPDSAEPCYQATALPNLFVLPAGQGTEEVVELLHSAQTAELLKRLRSEFDVVIIDTPPMLHMADTRILASHAQGAILVVRAGQTTRDEASKARDLFDQDRVRIVGTILNDFNPDKNGLPGYYKSYYRYMEEVTTSANGAVSWLDGLLSSERRGIEPAYDNGASAGGTETDFGDVVAAVRADEAHNGITSGSGISSGSSGSNGSNGNNGAIVTVSNPRRNTPHPTGPGGDPLEVFVSQFFMKIFNRGAMSVSTAELASLSESHGELYTPRTQDRRRTKRKENPELVAYYWDGAAPMAHDIRDISPTGLYLYTEERWYPGTQVMILLQRPGAADTDPDRSITVNAKVVRFGTDGLGFSFVMPEKQSARETENFGANGADRAAFYRFLQRLAENQG